MTETKERSKAVTKVRNLLNKDTHMTINAINKLLPELSAGQISMSLCYLTKKQVTERIQVDRLFKTGRKEVYAYRLKNHPDESVINV
jgi:hypothetical protein